jgi:copper chaperone CopZ
MKAVKFKVTDITNDQIVGIKDSISSYDGINQVRIDPTASTITVDFDESEFSERDIKYLIDHTGFNVKTV